MSLRDALKLYDLVIALPPSEREPLLSDADAETRRVVVEMLNVQSASLRFRTGMGWDLLATDAPQTDVAPPTELPGYRISGVLGRGGMGQVLDAEQQSPKRRVALKIIHPWLVSARSKAWLRDESEAMAALLHPGIPQVYAFEEHDDLSFLVMERVDGQPLAKWAAERSIRERVLAMSRVAQAVAHAHGRGFLHLDLKPENVLVTAEDQPKVLDFGLSRTLVQAEDGAAGGTPAYMAPEQKAGERVDLRTDVFALGVTLWDLLRGERATIHTPLVPLDSGHPELSGELAAIVAKATAANMDDRYPSVEALGLDLQAHLENRPVSAHPGGPLYRWRCALRRSPALWSLGLVAALSLTAGTAVSLERAQVAERAQQQAIEAQNAAEMALEQSEQDASRARASADFLTEVFSELNPRETTGKTTLLAAAEVAMQRLEAGALADAPSEAIRLRLSLAETLMHRGETDTALALAQQAEAAYGPDGLSPDPQLIDALHIQAMLAQWRRQYKDAQTLAERALSLAESLGDPGQSEELLHTIAVGLYSAGDYRAAAAGFEVALDRKRANPELDFSDRINTMNQVGHMRYKFGDLDGAQALFTELSAAAERKELSTKAAIAHQWLARIALDRGQPDRALKALDTTTLIRDQLSIDSASPTRTAELVLRAEILLALDDLPAARIALDRYLAVAAPNKVVARNDAAILEELLVREGRNDEARAVVEAAFARDVRGREGSGAWAWAYTTRGLWRARVGEPGANEDLTKALSVWQPRFGPENLRVKKLRAALQ